MWQRFTKSARRVVFFAQEEAVSLAQSLVSTEHLLLGLIRDDESVASKILVRRGFSLELIRSEVLKLAEKDGGIAGKDMHLSLLAENAVNLAYEEAREMGEEYIGTEHLLLGLVREKEGLAGLVLASLGVTLEIVREELIAIINSDSKLQQPIGEEANLSNTEVNSSSEEDPMWQRFTERARRVVFFAQEEAGKLGESYVSTEHMLLGLVRENDNVAARILERMGVSLSRIKIEIEQQVQRGDGRQGQDMQLTPRAKRVIDLSYDEARQLSNEYIGTEHLLLGLVREEEGLAGRVLMKLGATLEKTRTETQKIHNEDKSGNVEKSSASSNPFKNAFDFLHSLNSKMKIDPVNEVQATRDILEIVNQKGYWRGRDLITLIDVTPEGFHTVLNVAAMLKALHAEKSLKSRWEYPRTLGMIFEKPSLRTRVSFEAGMAHLGGHAIYLSPSDIGLGTREPVADVARALSRWCDIVSARVFKHETVVELALHASVPVINSLSELEHPLQAFADLLTLREHKGPLGNNLKLAYIGDGNNVLHALLIACAKMGVNLSAACPEGYFPEETYLAEANRIGETSGAKFEVTTDPTNAVKNADAVYTDVWASMGQEEEAEVRKLIFAEYQVTSELMTHAKPDAIAMHDLPAHKGEEIAFDVFEAHQKIIFDQAENRMHTQKALILLMLGL